MIELRPYQSESIDSIYQYFMEKSGNPLVVLPTGTGKSIVLGEFVRTAIEQYPTTRVLMLTHVKELIVQNYDELKMLWPDAPAGIYSAGIGRRDMYSQICYAGIQSFVRKVSSFPAFDLVLIDEAHLIPRSASSMYGKTLASIREKNPRVKVIGFTATPYRLDSGMLHKGDDAIFDDICYEAGIATMIEEGYLCPPRPKQTETELKVDGVHKRGGEFIPGELQAAVNTDELTSAAVDEITAMGEDRGSWLIFCSGVAHAEDVAAEIRSRGITCEAVLGETNSNERDRILGEYKAGKIRALTNANVLTTGFNAPGTDLIALMRPTHSTGLHVQMIGRGTRIAEGKEDCLVLDFARNVARHGPLDKLMVKEAGGDGSGEAPVKTCEVCQAIVYAGMRICPMCGTEFPAPKIDIAKTAATDAILTSQIRSSNWPVHHIMYSLHARPGKTRSMLVTYTSGHVSFKEWICFEHTGYARGRAQSWWNKRFPGAAAPLDCEKAIEMCNQHAPIPAHIETKPEGKYTKIMEVEFA